MTSKQQRLLAEIAYHIGKIQGLTPIAMPLMGAGVPLADIRRNAEEAELKLRELLGEDE